MSLVASYFAPVQNNPFGFLSRESFTSIHATLYNTGVIYKADKGTKEKKDALISNTACYMMFDDRGLTMYKDDTFLYTVPGIKTLQVKSEGLQGYVSLNGRGWPRELLDPVQASVSNYYDRDGYGLTLTSYGDLIMQDKTVRKTGTSGTRNFQTKHFSLARYYLAITKRLINVSQYISNRDEVPSGATIFMWDVSKGNLTKQTPALSFAAQGGYGIWSLVKITSDDKLQAMTSDNNDNITAVQWDYNDLFNIKPPIRVTSFSVKTDGFYVNDARVNKKALSGVKTMYFCLDGDLILCDTYGNMLWSLYVEAAEKAANISDYITENKEYTAHVISAVNEYSLYLPEFKKAMANYTLVDSAGGKLKSTLYSTNSLSTINATGQDDYLLSLYDNLKGDLTSGSIDSVYEKLKTNTTLKNTTIKNVTNPVKFLQGNPSAEQATSEGNKIKTATESLKTKRDAINTITNSLVESYKIPFPLIAIKGGSKNQNPATLLIKEALLYAGGSITEYTDVTGLIGAWASFAMTDADKLDNDTIINGTEWNTFTQAIHSKPSSTNTLKVTYELSGQPATFTSTSGSISFKTQVNCKVDWSKCVNSSQKYEITAYPFDGGTACPTDLPADKTQKCVDEPVNCVGGWGSFSACENGKQTKRYLVTTPAAYGGTACLANGTPDYITQDCTVPTTTTTTDTKDEEEDEEEDEDDKSFWEKYKWYVIGGGGGLFLLIIAVVLFFVLKKSPKAAT